MYVCMYVCMYVYSMGAASTCPLQSIGDMKKVYGIRVFCPCLSGLRRVLVGALSAAWDWHRRTWLTFQNHDSLVDTTIPNMGCCVLGD